MSANQQPPPGPGPLWTTLVERVAGGDPSALQTLCASLAGLKGYFCKHVGPDDAEDMFHDLIIVLTRQIQEGALKEPERFLGYVRAIAQRRIAAQIRVRSIPLHMVMRGSTNRSNEVLYRVASVAMRAKLCGFHFTLAKGGLKSLVPISLR